MKTIVVDVWQDLRDKKLAPVAILLLAALIAVPTLMAKSPSQAPPPASPAANGAAAAAADSAPQLQPVTQLEDSDLDTYSAKNPFAPLPQLKSPEDLEVVSGPGADQPAGSGSGVGSTTTAGGGASEPISGGGGSGGSPVPQFMNPGSTPDAQSTLYTYVADLDFGPPGNERARNGVARLQILPNEEKPLLVFLGIAADNKQAVFLADSTASQSGEGRCKPDVETCTFIYLTVDEKRNEHVVTDAEGQDYLLRLREIRRVKVDDLEKREAKRNKAKNSATRSGDSAREGVERLFASVLFADEEE